MRISNWIKKTKPQLQSPGKKTVFHCSPSVSIHEKRRPNCCEHLVPNDRTNNHGKTIGSNRGFMEAQPTKTQSSCLISSGYSLPNSKCCRIYIYVCYCLQFICYSVFDSISVRVPLQGHLFDDIFCFEKWFTIPFSNIFPHLPSDIPKTSSSCLPDRLFQPPKSGTKVQSHWVAITKGTRRDTLW